MGLHMHATTFQCLPCLPKSSFSSSVLSFPELAGCWSLRPLSGSSGCLTILGNEVQGLHFAFCPSPTPASIQAPGFPFPCPMVIFPNSLDTQEPLASILLSLHGATVPGLPQGLCMTPLLLASFREASFLEPTLYTSHALRSLPSP